jgi:hypothetical protein
MIVLFYLLLFSEPVLEKKEIKSYDIVIKGDCTFIKKDKIILVDKILKIPLKEMEVTLVQDSNSYEVKTDKEGVINYYKPGIFRFYFNGSEFYESCEYTETFPIIVKSQKKNGTNYFKWFVYLGFIVLLFSLKSKLLWILNKIKIRVKADSKKLKSKFDDNFVRIQSNRFNIKSLFSNRIWDGKVFKWRTKIPLKNVSIKFENRKGKIETFSNQRGEFRFIGSQGLMKVSLDGYKINEKYVTGNGGQLKVQLIPLKDWVLILLKKICEKQNKIMSGIITPREAIDKNIPPSDVIERLEILAYSNEIPSEEELDLIKKIIGETENLNPDSIGFKSASTLEIIE